MLQSGIRGPVEAGVEIHRDIALLKSVSAYEAYRKYYDTGLHSKLIYEFLLLNETFPRSVRYCLELFGETIGKIQLENLDASSKALEEANALASVICNIQDEAQITVQAKPSMQDLINQIAALSMTLSSVYFTLQPVKVSQTQSQSQV
jgi:uncharacterized alpha-E superfamily protein